MTVVSDVADARLASRYHATLGRWLFPAADGIAPLGLHWCLFPPLAETDRLGPDGHAPRTHAIDPGEFPRRMWVGGELAITAPLPLGRAVDRRSTPRAIEIKHGTTGRMALTGIDHEWSLDGAVLLRERQDIAYRAAAGASAPSPGSHPVGWDARGDLVWHVPLSTALLFRYSALTFNSHRIHYDAPYARESEGYPDIVVQGPLQATLLLNLAATLLGRTPSRFAYRATSPLLVTDGLIAVGSVIDGSVRCAVYSHDGRPTMTAQAG